MFTKKFLSLMILGLLTTNVAIADSRSYLLPKSIHCNNDHICDYDNTYFRYAEHSGEITEGTYTFRYANRFTGWIYVNEEKKVIISLYPGFGNGDDDAYNIVPDTSASGNQWNNGSCGSFSHAVDVSNCPFTNTPFHKLPNVEKSHSLNKANSTNSKSGNIIVDNQTNYFLILHPDDYLFNATVAPQQIISPHSQVVGATYTMDPKQSFLTFDVEIVSDPSIDNRNVTNTTTLFYQQTEEGYSIKYFSWILGDTYLEDFQRFSVSFELNTDGTFHVKVIDDSSHKNRNALIKPIIKKFINTASR